MAYSKKLSDLIAYYSMRVLPQVGEFVSSSDNLKVTEFCSKLEKECLTFMGKQFKASDYSLNVPVLNADYEPTGNYEGVLDPLLPFDIANENLVNPYIEVKLPVKGKIAWIARKLLENLAKAEIGDSLFVVSRPRLEHNQKIESMVNKYIAEIGNGLFAWTMIDGIIYAKYLEPYIPLPGQQTMLDLLSGQPKELSEEEIARHNLMGLLSALETGISKAQQIDEPNGPKGWN